MKKVLMIKIKTVFLFALSLILCSCSATLNADSFDGQVSKYEMKRLSDHRKSLFSNDNFTSKHKGFRCEDEDGNEYSYLPSYRILTIHYRNGKFLKATLDSTLNIEEVTFGNRSREDKKRGWLVMIHYRDDTVCVKEPQENYLFSRSENYLKKHCLTYEILCTRIPAINTKVTAALKFISISLLLPAHDERKKIGDDLDMN